MKRIRFGKYDLIEKIASGGMAEIWLAKQSGVRGFAKLVVIKRIHKHLSHDGEFVAMFINEARVAAQLTHQNIVQIYDFGEFQSSHYIAMEYIHGKDLKTVYNRSRMTSRRIPIELSIYIIQQICNGLDYAHRKRDYSNRNLDIVHRDVSPQNVLISQEGEIKITDFGIAKAATQLRATQAGTLKGKIAYMSPEQAWGKDIDRRSDIFAIGIIFYEILLNKRLFLGSSDLETLENVRSTKRTTLRDSDPSIPAEVERIIQKSLDRDPARRFQSAREMYQDLEAFSVQNGFLHQPYHLAEFMRDLFQDKQHDDSVSISSADEPVAVEPPPREVDSDSVQRQESEARESRQSERVRRKTPEVVRHTERSIPNDAPLPEVLEEAVKPLVSEPVLERLSQQPPSRATEAAGEIQRQSSSGSVVRSLLKNDQFVLRLIFVSVILLVIVGLFIVQVMLRQDGTLANPTASLALNSNVAGARVYFDNQPLGELTQRSGLLQKLPAGQHVLYIKADGYKEYSVELDFKQGEQKTLTVELKPYTGMLSIAANTGDAKVIVRSAGASLKDMATFSTTINQASSKDNPRYYLLDEIPVGQYTLRVSKDNVPGYTSEITIHKDEVTRIFAEIEHIEAQWTLSVTSNVSDATILLDGVEVGQTLDIAAVQIKVRSGNHSLTVKKDGYQDFSRDLVMNGDLPVYANLQSMLDEPQESLGGTIIIYSNETGVILFLDGHRIETTRSSSTNLRGIPPGKHELVAVKSGFREVTKVIEVQRDEVTSVDLTMEPSQKR